jgi:transcriptional regulator with GAF, ATPase, and Fis domain
MMIPSAQPSPLIAALQRLGPHDHLCSIYETQEEHYSVAIPFIRVGLDRGEKCIYIADDGKDEMVREAMYAEGIDVERVIADRSLILTARGQTYLKSGSFDPDCVLSFWKEATQSALSEGFSALRATGETEWLAGGYLAPERWIEYETRVTDTLTQNNCFALCQYDRRILTPEIILDLIRTHPIVVYRGTVCRNLYYVPPDDFLGNNHAAREVERMLTNILERERLDSTLRDQKKELQRAREILAEDITRRRDTDSELLALKDELGAELAAMTRLHRFSTRLLANTEVQPLLEEVLSATMELQNADFGNVQLYNPQTQALEIVAQRGFQREFLDYFASVREGGAACGRAMQRRERIIIEDVQNDAAFEPHRQIAASAGFRAVQSTPFFSRTGELLGMLSTHFRQPHRPSERDLRLTDLYVVRTAELMERNQAGAALEKAFEEIQILKDRLYHENLVLREEVDQKSMFEEIIGSSPAVRAVLSRVAKVAPMDSTVLIMGETGTGKELIARAIHKRSKRSAGAFIAFNCAGIPPSLIATELFGHEKGAFTGAQQRRLGRFELAEGGTIFLDEVGELPAETQIALLRVIQEREFERVGGAQPIPTNVRVIAATNRNLEDAVVAGTFRLDLFYRLNVFPIKVPPLRERKQDIPMLLEYFIKRYASRAGKTIESIDKKALELFKAYRWPGNIRELQNVIERSVIVCENEVFSVDESWLSMESVQTHRGSSTLTINLLEQEKKIIEAALAESKGRVAGPCGAAASLGMPSSTLESKIKALKINKHRFKLE